MYFIRHGESEFNLQFSRTGRDPGIEDAPLTARGKTQAAGAARHFISLSHHPEAPSKRPTRIIASPYTRALQTAHEIARPLGLKVSVNPLLGERRLYSCDIGTPCAKLKTAWAEADFSLVENDRWWPQANEGDADIEGRVKAFLTLEDQAREDALGEALVVSHWYFIFTASTLDCDNCQIVWRDKKGRFHRQG